MKNTLLAILFLISACLPCFCQQTVDDMFVTSFSKKYASLPSELIYLQTSKGIYETGEDLWFKAYQLNAQSFGLSDQSRTLYLQMVNSKDSVVWQEKYPVENGIASGHVYVGEKLPEGDYYLEAYSRHSFYKDITGILSSRKVRVVKNIAHDNQQSDSVKEERLRFDVFPEGGNLVSGLPFRVAFKATNGKGYPVEVKGTLYQIALENGDSYSLPEIYSQGMTLALSKQSKKYKVTTPPVSFTSRTKWICRYLHRMPEIPCCGNPPSLLTKKAKLQFRFIARILIPDLWELWRESMERDCSVQGSVSLELLEILIEHSIHGSRPQRFS